MGKFIDLTGQKFNRLTVLERVPNKSGQPRWLCLCDCGKKKEVQAHHIRSGLIRSCGCFRSEVCRDKVLTHGSINTAEYKIWASLKARCADVKHPLYGGRGIRVAPEWVDDFAAFFAHIGPRPSAKHSIDRIDNDRGYEPGNVRWATIAEQCRNRRSNRIYTIDGFTGCGKDIAERYGIKPATLYYRLDRNGDDIVDAVAQGIPHQPPVVSRATLTQEFSSTHK